MLSVPPLPGENRGERLGEFETRLVKTRYAVEGFHLLESSSKLCRGMKNMFYFLTNYILIML